VGEERAEIIAYPSLMESDWNNIFWRTICCY